MWYTTEVMPEDALVSVPFAADYPDAINVVLAVLTFIVLAMLMSRKRSTP